MTVVQIIDQDVECRERLKEVLSGYPDLDITTIIKPLRHTIDVLKSQDPDLIFIDINLPLEKGYEIIQKIRNINQHIPIIVFSKYAAKENREAIDALSAGASKLIEKKKVNSGKTYVDNKKQEFLEQTELLIKQYQYKLKNTINNDDDMDMVNEIGITNNLKNIKVIIIGASTGGIEAIEKIYKVIPEGFSIPIISVLHISDYFAEQLAQRLNACSPIQVKLAEQGEVIQQGFSYIAPGGYHTKLVKNNDEVSIKLDQSEFVNSCRPSVDVTLDYAADIYGRNMLAVILTGMGQDGLNGCRKVHNAGGDIFVQDKKSSVVWSMPGLVAKDKIANKISPITELGHDIINHVGNFSSIFNR